LGAEAGHWSITPLDDYTVRRQYVDKSMVLKTNFRTETGTVTVTDTLASGINERGHELGEHAPHCLIRVVECTNGAVELSMEFAPRPEYGLVHPLLLPVQEGLRCHGGPDTLGLSCPVPLVITDTARCSLSLTAGMQVAMSLHYAPAGGDPEFWTQEEILCRLQETVLAWRSWSDLHQAYEGPWEDLVQHSGRVLQALTFQPTGAIVAAPTTSLPEEIGGVRNWDYRYSWVRDASLTLHALWVAACPDEAEAFFRWMAQAASNAPEQCDGLQIMFGIRGERDLTERTLGHLPGWRNSAPVRVGNGAWNQRQLDVYGELLSAMHRLREYLRSLDPATKSFLAAMADHAATSWEQPDQGIWEVRSEPQHFLYSKLMCWVAVDRAVDLAHDLNAADRIPSWTKAREEIRTAIETHGWNEKVQAYTQFFGSDVLDAAALMMPIVGFAPPDDPRVLSTIRAVRENLTDRQGLVYRYLEAEDGLPGKEGAFILCTFWLSEALALSGDTKAAREVFARAARSVNDVGLLAEEVSPITGELLGNFPQAFSHIGLVNAAWAIHEAETARSGANSH
jgi:GH15 family glucan-1,4-alpha-glucosidase